MNKKGEVVSIEEKPRKPKSDFAVTGLYIYDSTVFDKMLGSKPSTRGEYEITYINNKFIEEGRLDSILLKKKWFDVGTFDSILDASMYMRKKKKQASK